ncbi:MAG: dynamin family protein [Bacillota bacterium]
MDQLEQIIDSISENIKGLGSDYQGSIEKLNRIQERLVNEQFHLAVLGQFKRGKSTLINALLGVEIMPSGIVPLTAIPTLLFYSTQISIRIIYKDSEDDKDAQEISFSNPNELLNSLSKYVTEEQNPGNQKGIKHVEVYFPAELLQKGMVLIDTPGIGSTLTHNTEVTYEFLPQCDAALFVVSADPPITEVELNFLQEVMKRVSRIFFVLNKTDYLVQAEREKMVSFLRSTLQEKLQLDRSIPIFCTSAQQGLDAQLHDNQPLWEESGLLELGNYLSEFLVKDKNKALEEALAQKTRDIAGELLTQIQLAVRSLELPLDDLQQRLSTFEKLLKEMEHEQVMAADLLVGDKKRIQKFVEDEAEKLRTAAAAHLEEIVEELIAKDNGYEQEMQKTFDEHIPAFFEKSFYQLTKKVEEKFLQSQQSHQARTNKQLNLIRQTAARIFDIPYYAFDDLEGFELKHRPYYISEKWETRMMVVPEVVIEKMLPSKMRRVRAINKFRNDLSRLVLHNVENIRWSLLQNLNESFHMLGVAVEGRIKETITLTHGVIKKAENEKQKNDDLVREEIKKLKDVAAIINKKLEHISLFI